MATIPASENQFPEVLFAEGAAPATPGTGLVKAYAKSDGLLYSKDDAGTETALGGDIAAHTGDTSDAHDASAISVLDTAANFTGTDVEAVLAELQDNIDAVSGGTAIPDLYVGSPQAVHSLGSSVAASLAADRVYIAKFIPSADITVDTAAWNCATSAGNIDIGIYNEALNSKLGSTGAFASPGTGKRTQALTGSVALTAGTAYYLAFWSSNASLVVTTHSLVTAGYGGWNLIGIQSSVSTNLPASVTATWDPGAIAFPIFFFLT